MFHAIELASRRWRGGYDSAAAETRCDDLIIALTSTRAGRAACDPRRRAAADAAAPFYDVARPRGRRVEREPHAHAARRAPARRQRALPRALLAGKARVPRPQAVRRGVSESGLPLDEGVGSTASGWTYVATPLRETHTDGVKVDV